MGGVLFPDFLPQVHAVGGADFAGDFEREMLALGDYGHGVVFEAQLSGLHDDGACVGARDYYLVAGMKFSGLEDELAHTQFGIVAYPLGYVSLDATIRQAAAPDSSRPRIRG